mgnify:CR=1 FL=1
MTDSLRYDIMKRDRFKCVLCGSSASDGAVLHVDHIIPVSKGGYTTEDNLVAACARCNLSKGAKTAEEFTSVKLKPLPMEYYTEYKEDDEINISNVDFVGIMELFPSILSMLISTISKYR